MISPGENLQDQPEGLAPTSIERQLFGELVKANQSRIRNYIGSLGVANCSIDDIAQEAFVVAFRRFGKYDRESSFASWVCSIARNLLWNDRRKTRRRYELLNEYVAEFLLQPFQEFQNLMSFRVMSRSTHSSVLPCVNA